MSEVASPGLAVADAADRAGVDVAYVEALVRDDVLRPASGGLTEGDVRRISLIRTLEEAGLPLEAMVSGIRSGLLSLSFVDSPEYSRLPTITRETFAGVSARTGVPVALLILLRETIGFGPAGPEDRMRSDELRVVPFLEIQVRLGFDPLAIERLLRAIGDNSRRIAEAEAEWWRSQVSGPRLDAGETADAVSASGFSAELSQASQDALLAIYNAQQAQTWTSNILGGFQFLLARGGLYEARERPPAICFLDITGYTRLTQERGDAAAAELADTLARLVKRTSGEHGGRPIKWLGDGVMFYFRDPGPGVLAALEMLDGITSAGLPPAHVGLHCGPVVIQEGDYYGATVNMAARIAEYARPGELLVSRAVFEAASTIDRAVVTFSPIGNVDLKGVAGTTELFAARRTG